MSTLPTWDELYQWACSKEADTVVGNSGLARFCPLATYLREIHDENWFVRVGYAWQEYYQDETEINMEPWMTQIVQKVDALGFMTVITASMLKHILEQVAPSIT